MGPRRHESLNETETCTMRRREVCEQINHCPVPRIAEKTFHSSPISNEFHKRWTGFGHFGKERTREQRNRCCANTTLCTDHRYRVATACQCAYCIGDKRISVRFRT